jgi:ankyrin repeat protein
MCSYIIHMRFQKKLIDGQIFHLNDGARISEEDYMLVRIHGGECYEKENYWQSKMKTGKKRRQKILTRSLKARKWGVGLSKHERATTQHGGAGGESNCSLELLLYRASEEGNSELVKTLLNAEGINVNQANNGHTPLWIASRNGHVEVVKMLLGAKDIKVKKVSLFITPLEIALMMGHVKVVEALLNDEDIDVNEALSDGSPPLFMAMHRKQVEMVKMLLDAKDIDVNQYSDDGITPLSAALYMSQYWDSMEMVKMLLGAKGIDVNKPKKNGYNTPLSIAKINRNQAMVELLQNNGAK